MSRLQALGSFAVLSRLGGIQKRNSNSDSPTPKARRYSQSISECLPWDFGHAKLENNEYNGAALLRQRLCVFCTEC